jgi:hypothetical protein
MVSNLIDLISTIQGKRNTLTSVPLGGCSWVFCNHGRSGSGINRRSKFKSLSLEDEELSGGFLRTSEARKRGLGEDPPGSTMT